MKIPVVITQLKPKYFSKNVSHNLESFIQDNMKHGGINFVREI